MDKEKTRNPPKPLVAFKAGRLFRSEKNLVPDTRRGEVIVDKLEDNLLHFLWKDLESGQIELDRILFQEDANCRNIRERVFMLNFASSSEKHFFWMQTPDSNIDEKLWEEINLWIHITHTQLEKDDEDNDPPLHEKNLLEGIDVDLSDVISPQHIEDILPSILPNLISHLPSGFDYTKEDVRNLLRFPAFKYATKSLSQALKSPQNPLILRSLGLTTAPDDNCTVLNFLNAINAEVNENENEKGEE